MKFTEYNGMILLPTLESVTKRVAEIEASDRTIVPWQYERNANHTHARMSLVDREHVLKELEMAAYFRSALIEQYPERSFVISHIPCYAVSFYQATESAPSAGILPVECWKTRKETVWCQSCKKSRNYRALPVPDPVFSEAEWGACELCGTEMIVYSGEILTLLKASR